MWLVSGHVWCDLAYFSLCRLSKASLHMCAVRESPSLLIFAELFLPASQRTKCWHYTHEQSHTIAHHKDLQMDSQTGTIYSTPQALTNGLTDRD